MNENVNETTVDTSVKAEGAAEGKTYTESEVMELLQKETDRRITSALKKQQAKYEKELSLSKLDENSRATAEKDMRISELEAKLAEYQVEKNRSELKSVLSSRGLSAQFADLLQITDDLEESQSRIETLDKIFKECVAEEVKKRISAGGKPQVGTSSNTLDTDSFKKMSVTDKQKLFETNPELYKRLNG